jgi:co-chaperonin GroES (HSP10)
MGKPRPKAIGEFVIVQLKGGESSPIVIPETAQHKAYAGSVFKVIDVGRACKYVKPRDQIIISAPASTEFDYAGEHYFALPESRIAVVLR